jgi:hypothetical protein
VSLSAVHLSSFSRFHLVLLKPIGCYQFQLGSPVRAYGGSQEVAPAVS